VHGILASQIALDINATGLNLTISQRDISFEAALANGMEQLEAGRVDLMLVGGADELTPLLHEIGSRALQVSLDPSDAQGLDPGARRNVVIPGDGAAVAVLEREGKPLARMQGARVGRHDHDGPDAALELWRALGKPALDLITNNRDGGARSARVNDAREDLWRREGKTPFASHRGAFGTFPTAGALQFAANVLMLSGGEAFAPVGSAPRAILHDAASSSGAHAAYLVEAASSR
jgi:hypothetical protein